MITVNKSRLTYVLIFILIALDLDCFYLIDTNSINLFGVSYLDIVFLFHVAIFAVSFICDKGYILLHVNKWNVLMVMPIVLAVLSAYAGTITYAQPFILGFVSQREWLGCMLMFFPVSRWLDRKIVSLEGVKNTIFLACIVMLCVYGLQYVVGDYFIFTYTMSSERYGEARYYFETAYLVLMAGIAIDNIVKKPANVKNRKYTMWQALFIIAMFFTVAVIIKGRMLTISVAVTFLLCLLLLKMDRTKKIILCLGVLIVAIMFLSTDIASDAISTLQGTSVEYDTLSVRSAGREYYMQYWLSNKYSIFLGCGSPNLHWEVAQEITNPLWSTRGTARFFLVDNGIFGEIFIYGLCGLAWFLCSIALSLKTAIKVYRNTGKVGYFLFVLADLIACITLVPNQYGGIIVFPLYLAILRYEFVEVKNNTGELEVDFLGG